MTVPVDLRDDACAFRWWQPSHSGENRDVWAIDDVTIDSHVSGMAADEQDCVDT